LAVRFSLHPTQAGKQPFDMGKNPCYLSLMEDYAEDIDYWDANDLKDTYGNGLVREILNERYLIEYKNVLKLSFTILGTPTNLILKFIEREISTFNELLKKFPRQDRYPSSKLKNDLIFLSNFCRCTYFALPGSALTCIALDGNESVEQDLNEILALRDGLEERFVYQMDTKQEMRKSIKNKY
jgi:hypothetical protein